MARPPLTPEVSDVPNAAVGGGPPSSRPVVLVVGDVIDDVVVRPLTAVTHGSDTPAEIRSLPGGSGANTAAWLGELGAAVRFAGRVGVDGLSGHTAALARHRVDARLVGDVDLPSGAIVLLVGTDAERTMYVERGANRALCPGDLPDSLLADVAVLHVSGYSFFLDSVRQSVLDLMARARRLSVTVTLDPGSVAFLRDVTPAAFVTWTSGVGVVFPNLDEARALTALEDPADVVRELLRWYEVAVVTLGPQGSIASTRREPAPVFVPSSATDVVDSTGAGDAFAAGFLARWLAAGDGRVELLSSDLLTQCLQSANAAAGRAVASLGGRPPLPAPSPLELP
ncbi:MAG: carbohydrate kinase family protein [Actinomycetales bacterium]